MAQSINGLRLLLREAELRAAGAAAAKGWRLTYEQVDKVIARLGGNRQAEQDSPDDNPGDVPTRRSEPSGE